MPSQTTGHGGIYPDRTWYHLGGSHPRSDHQLNQDQIARDYDQVTSQNHHKTINHEKGSIIKLDQDQMKGTMIKSPYKIFTYRSIMKKDQSIDRRSSSSILRTLSLSYDPHEIKCTDQASGKKRKWGEKNKEQGYETTPMGGTTRGPRGSPSSSRAGPWNGR